jgi:hypothetical protein
MYIPEIGRAPVLAYYFLVALIFWKIPFYSGTDRTDKNLHFLG